MTEPLTSPPPSWASYPVAFDLDAPLEVARWRPLVHWLLVIPQVIVADVLGQVAGLLAIVSWFTIVVTGRQLDGIARFQCMVLRYEQRVWSYALWLREPYPAFEFPTEEVDDRTDPVRVDVHTQLEGRNRLTVGLRFLWIIPAMLFAFVIWFAAMFVLFVGWFAVIILGRWPEGMRRFVIGALRVSLRVTAYGRLVVDEYPPFSLD
jgi:Domain of unknown function (DUF4389)